MTNGDPYQHWFVFQSLWSFFCWRPPVSELPKETFHKLSLLSFLVFLSANVVGTVRCVIMCAVCQEPLLLFATVSVFLFSTPPLPLQLFTVPLSFYHLYQYPSKNEKFLLTLCLQVVTESGGEWGKWRVKWMGQMESVVNEANGEWRWIGQMVSEVNGAIGEWR